MNRFILVSLIFMFFSCKSNLEKIDVNNIDAHRYYQDSAIEKGLNVSEKFAIINNLISEYRNLNINNKDTCSNYNYYLARLYGNVTDYAFSSFFYDSTNKIILNSEKYKNYFDSTFYYSELSLKGNPNNIRAMYTFARALSTEYNVYLHFKEINIEIPFSGKQNYNKWNDRINYLYNNFLKFSDIDTSQDKIWSRNIYEYAFGFIVNNSIDLNKTIDWNNQNTLQIFSVAGKCIEFLDKFTLNILYKDLYKKYSDKIRPLALKAEERINLGPVLNYLDKILINRGWSSTEHSLNGDISTSRGNFVENKNANTEESEITIKLKSDYTYSLTFKPIRYISTVTVNGKWKVVNNSNIEFDKDIFVSVPVTSADFPISEEPFHEYILIPKNISIINGYLVLDERTTNRNTYFTQLAIVTQNGKVNENDYTFKVLNELSLDKDLITQYNLYFK